MVEVEREQEERVAGVPAGSSAAAPPARLRYSLGNEHNPADPFGRTELEIGPDGGACLDHYARPGGPAAHRAWRGRVDPAVLRRLWAALGRAHFPDVPPAARHPRPPDSALRRLAATGDAGDGVRQVVDLPYDSKHLPGYDEAFALLDAIVGQLSAGTVRRTPAWPPGADIAVAGVQRGPEPGGV